jgi:hypothetical protein
MEKFNYNKNKINGEKKKTLSAGNFAVGAGKEEEKNGRNYQEKSSDNKRRKIKYSDWMNQGNNTQDQGSCYNHRTH